jgi:hypothetical protein
MQSLECYESYEVDFRDDAFQVAALFDEQLQSLFKKAGVRVHEKLGEAKDLLAQSILQQTNDACSEPHDAVSSPLYLAVYNCSPCKGMSPTLLQILSFPMFF